jgi:two-component system sensor histidine kinase UhpB
VGRGANAAMQDEVVRAREAVRSSLEEVREIARRLRPEALDDLGLPSALAALTNDIIRRTRLPVERRIASPLPPLAPDEELVVYRVGQEALTNVVRHAAAGHAHVALGVREGHVELEVRDDGQGFEPRSASDGTGLRGMRERAVLVGADLVVSSASGQGTTVRLRLAPR